MMRMSDYVSSDGTSTIIFVLIAFVVFLTVFAGVVFYIWFMKKEDVAQYASLPLEEGSLSEPTALEEPPHKDNTPDMQAC